LRQRVKGASETEREQGRQRVQKEQREWRKQRRGRVVGGW
jgi:hypothetical protein